MECPIDGHLMPLVGSRNSGVVSTAFGANMCFVNKYNHLQLMIFGLITEYSVVSVRIAILFPVLQNSNTSTL